jgi:hypothetical protein
MSGSLEITKNNNQQFTVKVEKKIHFTNLLWKASSGSRSLPPLRLDLPAACRAWQHPSPRAQLMLLKFKQVD